MKLTGSNNKVDVSVVVPIFEQWGMVNVLLNALAQQSLSFDKWECFVVDNGSSSVPNADDLPDFVSLLNCEKPGSYAARNEALKYTKGSLVVFTDADCFPTITWLEMLWDAFSNSNGDGIIAGGVEVKKFDNVPYNIVELYDRAMGLPQARYVKRGYAVTANLAVPAHLFEKVGLFDDSRFSGGDADFCRRVVSKGYQLTYVPEALVYHPARDKFKQLVIKIKRVKGGQICSGIFSRRFQFFIRTFIPPVFAFYYAITSKKITSFQKAKVCFLQLVLWFFEMRETVSLIFGKKPERR